MTTEEKAKRYDEVLENIKELYSKGSRVVVSKEEFETIFPELAESEDERIREAQLDYWRSVGGKEWHGVPVQEAIAWLEKQGEQKSVDKVEPKFNVGDWIISKYDEIYQVKEILTRSYNLLCENGTEEINSISIVDNNSRLLTIFDIKNLIKQEEKQKWQRWNEEDIKFIDMLIKEKEDALCLSCDVKESISLTYCCNALKLIKQRMKEQL